MLAVTVSVRVKPDRRDQFLEAIVRQADASRELEPGCVRFDVLENEDDPLAFLLIEVYSEPSDFYEAHRETQHYAEWLKASAEVLEGERTITTYKTVRFEVDST